MKKIVLKSENCIGCGACVGIDAEHFEFTDDGFSIVKSQENLDSTALQDAIDACPVAIISLQNSQEDVLDKMEKQDMDKNVEEDDCECQECYKDHCSHCNCHDEKKAA